MRLIISTISLMVIGVLTLTACVSFGSSASAQPAPDSLPSRSGCQEDEQVLKGALGFLSTQMASTHIRFVLEEKSVTRSPATPTLTVKDAQGQVKTIPATDDAHFLEGWKGDAPSPALVTAFARGDYRYVPQCEKVLEPDQLLPILPTDEVENAILIPKAGAAPASTTGQTDSLVLVGFEGPTYNSDKTEALMYAEFFCKGLCGRSQFLLLKKTNEGWKEVGDKLNGVF